MCDPSSEATFLPRGAISASLGFPLHSAEISMSSRFVGRPQAFPDRASRGALFLTSLLILALLSLLAYVVKNSLVIQKLDPAPCSANCTIYASPSGNDKNSGSDPSSPKTFLGAAAATRPGSLVCLLPGTYDLDSSFTPTQSGAASAWIVQELWRRRRQFRLGRLTRRLSYDQTRLGPVPFRPILCGIPRSPFRRPRQCRRWFFLPWRPSFALHKQYRHRHRRLRRRLHRLRLSHRRSQRHRPQRLHAALYQGPAMV